MLDVMLDGSAAEPESRCDFPTGSPQNQESGNIPLARAEVKRSAIRPDPKRTTKPLAVDGYARGASELTQVPPHRRREAPGLPLGEDHSANRAAGPDQRHDNQAFCLLRHCALRNVRTPISPRDGTPDDLVGADSYFAQALWQGESSPFEMPPSPPGAHYF